MLLERNEKMTIHGDGRIMRGSPYAADAADALDVIFHKGAQGEVYNITSADQLQVLEVDGKISDLENSVHRILPMQSKW
jgi:dTDP-D-glucose 4,6-dehydratase